MSLPRPYLWVLMTSIDNMSWVGDLTWLSYALEQPEWLRSLQNTVLENMQLFLPLLYLLPAAQFPSSVLFVCFVVFSMEPGCIKCFEFGAKI